MAIEIDGDSHYRSKAIKYDKVREEYVRKFGVRFVRFTNIEVMQNLAGVLDQICIYLT